MDEGEKKSTVRTIDCIDLHFMPRYKILQVAIKGKSFLRFQIRRMIGYALDVARQAGLPADYIKDLLNNPNSKQRLVKADAKGLCLKRIIYG